MARKTFISYKYSDSQNTRDRIIRALGQDGSYYRGETSQSPDMGDLRTETIKSKLSDMIFPTSVMIVIMSQNIDQSSWVKWEINYVTSRQSRNGRQSQPNGIVMITDNVSEMTKLITGRSSTVENLIDSNSKAVKVSLEEFLKYPSYYIDEAYRRVNG